MKNPFAKKKSGLSRTAKVALGAAGLLLIIVGLRRSSEVDDEGTAPQGTLERDPLL